MTDSTKGSIDFSTSPSEVRKTFISNMDVPPPSFTFHSSAGTDGVLFTIKADGEIVRGPKFTTEDEMSLMFWKRIAEAFPRFLEAAREQHPQ